LSGPACPFIWGFNIRQVSAAAAISTIAIAAAGIGYPVAQQPSCDDVRYRCESFARRRES
jgi:hypothetical protein